MEKNTRNILAGSILGFIFGGAAGVLLAPKSGKDLRAEAAEQFNKIKKKFVTELETPCKLSKKAYSEILQKVVDTYKEAKKITSNEANEIKKKLEGYYSEILETMKCNCDEQREKKYNTENGD